MTTATMTRHARQRCESMGISTKVAKRIVANAEIVYNATRPGESEPAVLLSWQGHPEYRVVAVGYPEAPVVVTVVYRSCEDYASHYGADYAASWERRHHGKAS